VVCANTYAMALGEGGIGDLKGDQFSREVAIRHMGDVGKKLEIAKKALVAANQAFDKHAEMSRALAKHSMTGELTQEALRAGRLRRPAPVRSFD
jgi:hypothetical protein